MKILLSSPGRLSPGLFVASWSPTRATLAAPLSRSAPKIRDLQLARSNQTLRKPIRTL